MFKSSRVNRGGWKPCFKKGWFQGELFGQFSNTASVGTLQWRCLTGWRLTMLLREASLCIFVPWTPSD